MESTFKNVQVEERSKFLSAVFLYVFLFLAITAGVACLVGFTFKVAFPIVNYAGNVPQYDPSKEANFRVYMGLLIGSGILMFILMFWITFVTFRQKGRIIVPFILYSVVMGVFISSFGLFLPFEVIAISFGITVLIFGIMFLIGYFAKPNTSVLWMIVTGIFVGALFVSLFNIIYMLITRMNNPFTWIVSYAIFFAMMLVTIIDVANIRAIADRGMGTKNLALFCAFNLYVDFIYIFIRVLSLVARFSNRN